MYLLGLHNDEDCGVCLMRDGHVLEAVNEERFNRIKLCQGLPELSLQYVLEKYDLALADIEFFVYGWYGRQLSQSGYAQKLTRRIIKAMTDNPACGDIVEERVRVEFERCESKRAKFESWMAELGIPPDRQLYVDHHASHAWSAFGCSPFDSAFVFTFDGRGDLKSGTVSVADSQGGIDEKDYLLSLDSIGFLYGQITTYLGFKAHRHEGKVTGLAAYGNAAKTLPLFRRLISWEDDTFVAKLNLYRPFYTNMAAELAAEFDKYRREDVAAGLQQHCEELVTRFIECWIGKLDRPDIKNVCLAGGVFANVRINQCVAEISGVDNIFVFPHMGDGGLPLGSICHANYLLTGETKVSFDSVFLGPQFDDGEIVSCLESYGSRISHQHLNRKVEGTVQDLSDQKVVGYFDGRMELGPRALGARSILCRARDPSVNDWLNDRLRRTEFMPFAPVTPVEYAAECYEGWKPTDVCTPYMTRTFNCTDTFRRHHRAVVHVDGTARPQVVTEDRNGEYYEIVKSYCDRHGDRALINTSFNAHEEPIVRSPRDAVESLLQNTVDVLVIGDHHVECA